MARYRLQTYERIHQFDHATDVERGKISRETGVARKAATKQEALLDRLMRDPSDDLLLEAQAEQAHTSRKEGRNAKGHKRRLNDLESQGLR